jgi:predicted deacylase
MIPKNLTIVIIPDANPDAVYKVTKKVGAFAISDVTKDKKTLESARFNAHGVDLNRNFDCKWQPKSTWRTKEVSAGDKVFSEPETEAIKSFMLKYHPEAVIFWHSQANGVYASACEKGILADTLTLMNTYAGASGYPAIKTFDAYPTTGAADDWLAKIGIPAITVELKTHESIEWEKNLKGVQAILEYYSK